ncbi:hypothetical protein B0J11DRAFT_81043 [Dendryphion nanum]|uniref:Uncharacterized protein n=1 Tax=Dendryphion nanum TaxID=256645 RepID=A0A9P9IEL5_9PLEO|nr:hypothetical protein B0J11DRAFT_81043 [Dendryphion nanum]
MAKKKKPAANPARGYATTSITSKSKPKDPVESDTEAPEKADTSSSIAELNLPSQAKNGALPPTKKVELTPEELEAQLLRDELQLLVEKHAAKARRESRRHILKFQTDQRVLRSQAQHMSVHDWVPNRALDSMVSLAQAESNDSNRRLAHKPLLKVTTEEDTISRLWTLDLTFRGLGFSHDQIQPVLRWLCANAAVVDSTASMWGFQEGFEWLALNQSDGHPFSFEGTTSTNTAIADTPIGSRPETPVAVAVTDISQTLVPATSGRNSPTAVVSSETDVTDVAISDLDSDLEEDQLIETYLKIKERLFLIDPDVVDSKSKKLQKGSKSRNFKPPQPTHTAATRKLLSQLGQLESDVLFDQDEAEARWPDRRNLVAQARAAAKKDDAPTDIPASRNAIEKEKSVETDDQTLHQRKLRCGILGNKAASLLAGSWKREFVHGILVRG